MAHLGSAVGQIAGALGLSHSLVRYHLGRLEKSGRLLQKYHHKKRLYYPAGPYSPVLIRAGLINQILSKKNQQIIFETILAHPDITQRELIEATGIPQTTLQWHVLQLRKANAIAQDRVKNTVHYFANEDFIRDYQHIFSNNEKQTNFTH
jgi:predicted transcriptional regulator